MAKESIQEIGSLLQSTLRDLEEMRNPIIRRIRWRWGMLCLSFLGAVLLGWGLVYGFQIGMLILAGAFCLLGLGATIGLVIQNTRARKDYALAYKQQVYPKLLEVIGPTWSYNPRGMVGEDQFRESGLYANRWDRYKGDDLVTGRIGNVDFQCSELHAEEKHESRDADGHTSTSYSTLFKGMFFTGQHQMNLEGRTTILPFKKKGWISKTIDRVFNIQRHQKVEIHDAEFSELFMVHSTHPFEASNLIGHLQTTTLKELAKWVDPERIRIAYLPEKIFCAVSFKKDLFEPRLRGSLLDLEELHEAYELFTLNKVLVQGLVVELP